MKYLWILFVARVALGADDPAMKLALQVTPHTTNADVRAEVTGGEAPYHYRWSFDWYDHAQIGGDKPTLDAVTIQPFMRALICCVVTDARGQTGRAFRHVLPLPPGERGGPIRFFGIGDSIENSGEGVNSKHPAVIAVAAQACERVMGLPAGGIPWDRCSYPGYTSEEIARNMPAMLEKVRAFGATDVFIRMGLNDRTTGTANAIRSVALAVKEGCPSVQRVWIEPCTARAEENDRLWKIAETCKTFEDAGWLFYTCDAGHWHQRRAPDLYPDETHPGPEANQALGLTRAAAWIVKGPPSHPGIGRQPK